MMIDSMNRDEKIIHLYHVQRYSLRQIDKELGCSPGVARLVLIKTLGTRSQQEGCVLRTTDEYREKIRQTKIGEANHQSKLTADKVLAIREAYVVLLGTFLKTQAQHLLADEYGVKRPTISDIVLRKTWKHI